MNDASRRGVALLLVLAVLMLVVPACMALARLASDAQLNRTDSQRLGDAEQLLIAADGAILDWLSSESDGVVLPPDVTQPAVPVLNDRWTYNTRPLGLRITAWDQCGMVPARGPSAPLLASVLDASWRGAMAALTNPDDRLGLDQYLGSEMIAFPTYAHETTTYFGVRPLKKEKALPARPALGTFVATHSPNAGDAPAPINVNTAPRPLLEQAMRLALRGGIEEILEAREAGEQASVPSGDAESESRIVLVGSSSVWSFRVDAMVGPVRRSWWAVYRESEGEWRCAQRVPVR